MINNTRIQINAQTPYQTISLIRPPEVCINLVEDLQRSITTKSLVYVIQISSNNI